jgi:acyl carrier protein
MTLAEQLRDHIVRTHLPGEDPSTLEPDDELLDSGVLDSMGIVQLTSYVERQFGVEVLPEDICTENFGSAVALAAYIDSRTRREAG